MTKAKKRIPRLKREAKRYHGQAARQVKRFVWDADPIKQYVRRFGWVQVIRDYVGRRRGDGIDAPIKYLTIPGPNASDIGLLWRSDLLVRSEAGFPYVAICDDENADIVSKNLGTVFGVSGKSFHRAIHSDLVPLFPFDVINLDLCGAIITGAREPRKAMRTLAGIRQIFRLQRGQGFLLLLTTSTDDTKARRTMEQVLGENFAEQKFREAYLDRFGALDFSPFQRDYRSLIRLGLPKIIGRFARDGGYRIAEHFVARYDRTNHRLICYSFELEPLGRRDPANKYKPRISRAVWDYWTELLSGQVLRQAINAYENFLPSLVERDANDVRDILNADPSLEAELKREAKSLTRWWNPNA